MNEPSTVTYPTAEILKRIEDKLDKLDKQSEKLTTISVELAEIKTEVKNLNKDVTELKGSTKAQRKDIDQNLSDGGWWFFGRCG